MKMFYLYIIWEHYDFIDFQLSENIRRSLKKSILESLDFVLRKTAKINCIFSCIIKIHFGSIWCMLWSSNIILQYWNKYFKWKYCRKVYLN